MAFTGIPRDAVAFYAELEANNSREWWLANKQRYESSVRRPFVELGEEVAPAFGEPKVFRPYRDVRFSLDKTPYKTHQGLYVQRSAHNGWYLQVDSGGFLLAGGQWWMAGDQLSRFRSAVANDATGVQLEAILRELVEAGYVVEGEQLKTRPRGVDPDAPRMDLLRRKALSLNLRLGEPGWTSTPEAAEYVNDGWDELRDLVDWLETYVGNSEAPRGRR
ncbi:DUF2461 domain-containing protein [Luteococcus peritonei]|uniref:DUF2461 domain-containing protein n=1 Tax=Luteococcus peritonei TaxID=88874 RepID=A0ABW4RTM0_9ACTN